MNTRSGLRTSFSIVLFTGALSWAWWGVRKSSEAVVLVDLGGERGPAAVRRELDLSHLQGLALSKGINERLIGEARLQNRADAIGVQLGQFVSEDSDGRKRLACTLYSRVEMLFIGEGIAESGEQPKMIVSGPCRMAEGDLGHMAPLWIPHGEILRDQPGNKDLRFFGQEPVEVQLRSMASHWPRHWVLRAIRLSDPGRSEREVVMSYDEIRRVSPKSLVLNWSNSDTELSE